MGMTLWIHTLEGRTMSGESDDHSVMHDLADDLDKLCKELGHPALSSFFDTTDLELNMAEDDDNDEYEEPEPDAETGLAYGIEAMKWFDAAAGLTMLTALHSRVAAGQQLKLPDDVKQDLLDELADCIEKLKRPAASDGKFHLAVIM